MKRTKKTTTRRAPYRASKRVTYPQKRYVSGRGAYYIKGSGSLSASAKLPGVGKVSGGLGVEGGYATNNYIKGLGDYTIMHNVLMGHELPQIRNRPRSDNAVVIRHREYLGNVFCGSDGAFDIASYPLNPAMAQTFPWLSQVAANFASYSWDGMIFEFKSTSANAVASGSGDIALGSVIMATEYDSVQPEFQSKSEMLAYQYSTSCKPAISNIHAIECARTQSVLSDMYTRTGPPPSNADLRMYDLGRFSIATQGFQSATPIIIGELWVTYQVSLFKQKLHVDLGFSNDTLIAVGYEEILSVTDTDMFGVGANVNPATSSLYRVPPNCNNIPPPPNGAPIIACTASETVTVSFPKYPQPVQYDIDVSWKFTTPVTYSQGAVTTSAGVIQAIDYGGWTGAGLLNGVFSVSPAPSVSSSYWNSRFSVRVEAVDNETDYISWTMPNFPTDDALCLIRIQQQPLTPPV